jgi:molybdate transport system substrate-binding protein
VTVVRVVTLRIVVAALTVGGLLVACGGEGEDGLVVSAAASLQEAFTEMADVFEDRHPGTDVLLNFGGSSTLREQILEGSPVDVFASANIPNMEAVVEAGEVIGQPAVFATNRLQIAVPAGNPAGVESLADFSNETLFIGLCSEGVPCGDFAREALALAGAQPAIDSDEPDVRALLTKIGEGELDAGITYVTDVVASGGDVDGIEIPDEVNVVAEYPIAAIATGANPDSAEAFVELVLSELGQTILRDHGFSSP